MHFLKQFYVKHRETYFILLMWAWFIYYMGKGFYHTFIIPNLHSETIIIDVFQAFGIWLLTRLVYLLVSGIPIFALLYWLYPLFRKIKSPHILLNTLLFTIKIILAIGIMLLIMMFIVLGAWTNDALITSIGYLKPFTASS